MSREAEALRDWLREAMWLGCYIEGLQRDVDRGLSVGQAERELAIRLGVPDSLLDASKRVGVSGLVDSLPAAAPRGHVSPEPRRSSLT